MRATTLLALVSATALGAPLEVDVLLKEGDAAPDTVGTITRVYKASTNSSGEVAVGTRRSGATNRSLWSGDPSGLTLIAEAGQASPAPGTPNFSDIANLGALFPIINDNGDTAFSANAGGIGIFTHVGGSLNYIARHDDPAAGVPGTTYRMNSGNLELTAFALDGTSTFHGRIQDGGVTNNDDATLHSGLPGSVQLLARESALVDGETDIFHDINAGPIFNESHTTSNGTTVAAVNFTGAGVTGGSDDQGIVAGAPGNFSIVLQRDDPAVAPGLPVDAVFRGLQQNFPVRINNAGEYLFISSLDGTGIAGIVTAGTGNNIAIWTGTAGNFRIVARRGDPAPGLPAGVIFSIYQSLTPALDPLAIASTGDSVFYTSLTGSVVSSNNSAIFAELDGSLHPIAREGDAAPGLDPGVLFNDLRPTQGTRFAINANGVVLLLADLIGTGITNANDKALYFWTESDGLQLIAHEGALLETSPGVFQTVGTLSLNGTMGDDSGHGRNLNNRNEAVFVTELDGDEALLRAKLTIPATYALVTADSHSAAGGVLTSTSYESAATAGDSGGELATSADYAAKGHFAGQLYTPVSLTVTASPDPADEASSTQAAAEVLNNDGTILPLAPGDVDWSIVSGPLDSISATGLATTGVVYQDQIASIGGDYADLSGTGPVTVQDSDPDNFESYAGDGITDLWQVTNFGLPPNALAGPGENPDNDQQNNYIEWLTGYDPNDPTAFFSFNVISKVGNIATLELSKIVPGTRYFVNRSTDLDQADPWAEIDNFTTGIEQFNVPVLDNSALSPDAYYQIQVAPE